MSFLSSRLSELHCTFQWAGDFLLPLRTRCVRSPATEGRGYRLLPGAVLAALLVVIVTADAAAHAALESSTPATGDIVAEAPGQVTARFTEPLERSYSQLRLFDSQGNEVQGTTLEAGDDEYIMVLGLPSALPDGAYSVLWRTLSKADGHTAQNYFAFTVGSDADVAPVVIPSAGQDLGGPPQWLKTASRWAALVGLAALLAAWPVWTMIVRPALGPVWRSAPEVVPRIQRFTLAALLLAITGSVFALVVQAMTLPDGTLIEKILNTVGQTRYGELWLYRIVLILLTGLILSACAWWFPGERPSTWFAAWVVCLVLPIPFSLVAHASALTVGRAVAIVADVIHLFAASVWFGGLLILTFVLFPVLRSASPEQRRSILVAAIPRFSVLGLVSWAALGLTGFYAGWLHVGNLEALRSTDYGQSLIIKLGLLAGALILAATNLLVIQRRVIRRSPPGGPIWSKRLRWTVAAEAVLVLAALVAVGRMTSLQPARDVMAVRAQQISVPFELEDGQAELSLAPGTVGVNHFRLEVSENLLAPETEALLRLTIPEQENLGTSEIQLSHVSGSAFEYHGSELSIAGDWEITLILREQGAAPIQAVAEQAIRTTAPEVDVPGEPWRFETPGGVLGLLLVIVGVGGMVLGVYAGRSALRKESGGMGFAALVLGIVLLLQARVDPVLAGVGPYAVINPSDAAMVERGEAIYAANCLSCHGAELRGSGPESAGMEPPPADFSQPHTMVHSTEDLVYWIRNGKQGTAMPGFDDELSDQDIRDILSYITAQQQQFQAGS